MTPRRTQDRRATDPTVTVRGSAVNQMNKLGAACAICAAVLFAAAIAWGKNGVQNHDLDNLLEAPRFNVLCLGEYVIGMERIAGSFHEVVTPSGTWHLLDNWKTQGEFTDLLTGRT